MEYHARTPLQISGGATQEHLKNFGSKTAFDRPGQPAELTSIYVIADNTGSFATGQIYGSSGGSGQPRFRTFLLRKFRDNINTGIFQQD